MRIQVLEEKVKVLFELHKKSKVVNHKSLILLASFFTRFYLSH